MRLVRYLMPKVHRDQDHRYAVKLVVRGTQADHPKDLWLPVHEAASRIEPRGVKIAKDKGLEDFLQILIREYVPFSIIDRKSALLAKDRPDYGIVGLGMRERLDDDAMEALAQEHGHAGEPRNRMFGYSDVRICADWRCRNKLIDLDNPFLLPTAWQVPIARLGTHPGVYMLALDRRFGLQWVRQAIMALWRVTPGDTYRFRCHHFWAGELWMRMQTRDFDFDSWAAKDLVCVSYDNPTGFEALRVNTLIMVRLQNTTGFTWIIDPRYELGSSGLSASEPFQSAVELGQVKIIDTLEKAAFTKPQEADDDDAKR